MLALADGHPVPPQDLQLRRLHTHSFVNRPGRPDKELTRASCMPPSYITMVPAGIAHNTPVVTVGYYIFKTSGYQLTCDKVMVERVLSLGVASSPVLPGCRWTAFISRPTKLLGDFLPSGTGAAAPASKGEGASGLSSFVLTGGGRRVSPVIAFDVAPS